MGFEVCCFLTAGYRADDDERLGTGWDRRGQRRLGRQIFCHAGRLPGAGISI